VLRLRLRFPAFDRLDEHREQRGQLRLAVVCLYGHFAQLLAYFPAFAYKPEMFFGNIAFHRSSHPHFPIESLLY
jgi:hypothetical protein